MKNDPAVRRSECPISSSLDLLGDKWSLLVVRDLLDGKIRFSQFERSPEGIATNILTDRLQRLEEAGLVARVRRAGTSRFEYHPTEQTWALRPVLLALADWGNEHLDDTWIRPVNYLARPE